MKDESKNKKRLIAEIKELRSRLSEILLLFDVINYEIRTPLNSIIGFSGMLYKNETCEEKKELLYQIITNGRSLLALVDKMPSDVNMEIKEPLREHPEVIENSSVLCDSNVKNADNLKYKILLAEDNPSNAKLINMLLKMYGHEVVSVENGLQAVETVLNSHFDAVLMDIQMPVMNGRDASAAIRKNGCNVAIIALTACALKEEREECLKSGMDAFIIKPINIDELEPILHRVIKEKKSLKIFENSKKDDMKIDDAIAESAIQKTGIKNFDRDRLDEIMGGIEEIMREAVELFLEGINDNMDDIEKAIKIKDASLIKTLAHKLKGSALNACAEKTVALLTDIEKSVDESDYEKINELFEELNDAVNDFENEARKAGLYQ